MKQRARTLYSWQTQSGGERAAVQTLRDVQHDLASAKRLDCGGFSTAFERCAASCFSDAIANLERQQLFLRSDYFSP